MRRLRQLEEENRRLKRLVADLVLIWATLEEDRLVWRSVQMDEGLRLRTVEASRTVSADSINISALDRYLDAA